MSVGLRSVYEFIESGISGLSKNFLGDFGALERNILLRAVLALSLMLERLLKWGFRFSLSILDLFESR
jgi:hypothetical protein